MAFSIEEWRNIAVIAGVVISVIVYATNSFFQYKQRVSDNGLRYIDIHEKLFKNQFLIDNIQAMEQGTFKRDRTNEDSEKSFNRLLGEIEHLALLAGHGVISKTANIYMFGWFARHIQPVITADERNNVYWELAVQFLDELKKDADDFYKKSKKERDEYFKKKHFFH
jgi:hypothetical protein